MDEIHVHKTKKSICAHFAESPCKFINSESMLKFASVSFEISFFAGNYLILIVLIYNSFSKN